MALQLFMELRKTRSGLGFRRRAAAAGDCRLSIEYQGAGSALCPLARNRNKGTGPMRRENKNKPKKAPG